MKSYDLVGSIAILNEKAKNKGKIAKELLKNHKNIRTIVARKGMHHGLYRLRKTKYIAGEKTKETTHKENNSLIKLNIDTCYFSPRTASERLRIAKLVKKNETILVMFSGVAPYPLVIAKNANPKRIYGIEINEEAHNYALKNVKLNKLNNIELIKGNVKKIIPKLKIKFDRIIMPLPKTSSRYISLPLKHLKQKGYLHYYLFSRRVPQKQIKSLKIKKITKLNQIAPGKYKYCIDFKKVA